eukprot:7880183-Pyramimonas_sp.AAC.1
MCARWRTWRGSRSRSPCTWGWTTSASTAPPRGWSRATASPPPTGKLTFGHFWSLSVTRPAKAHESANTAAPSRGWSDFSVNSSWTPHMSVLSPALRAAQLESAGGL